jgi:hypothetical protein
MIAARATLGRDIIAPIAGACRQLPVPGGLPV